jgi:hypothetical protein
VERGNGPRSPELAQADRPLQLCELTRGQRTETRMRSRMIIIKPPGFDDLPRFGQTVEQVFVQALVAETAVEALDESVLGWLARFDVMPSHPTRDPTQDSYTSKFAAIVTDYNLGRRALAGETLEFARRTKIRQSKENCTVDPRGRGSQFLPEHIDADERLPEYLREPHLPRFESRRARAFPSSAFLKKTPFYPLNPPRTNPHHFRETPECDVANTYPVSPSLDAIR